MEIDTDLDAVTVLRRALRLGTLVSASVGGARGRMQNQIDGTSHGAFLRAHTPLAPRWSPPLLVRWHAAGCLAGSRPLTVRWVPRWESSADCPLGAPLGVVR